jgi:hypothetical protein
MQRYLQNNDSFRLMENSVMAQMNFKGHGCKFAFGQTKIFKIVCRKYLIFVCSALAALYTIGATTISINVFQILQIVEEANF